MQHQYWYLTVLCVFTLICVLILKPDAMGLNWARRTLSSSSSPSWYFWTPGFMAILSLNHDNDTLKLVSFLGLDPVIIYYQVYCLIPWQVSFQKTKWLQPSHSSFFFWKIKAALILEYTVTSKRHRFPFETLEMCYYFTSGWKAGCWELPSALIC